MNIRRSYSHTLAACCISYIVQAIVNNFAPLLFLTFGSSFGISLDKITLLVTFNFMLQLAVDLIAAKTVDRIGYRRCIIFAHIAAALGLAGLGVFPYILPDPFVGLVVAIVLYAVGGGLIEVLVSPIVEASPSERKASVMSLLHSFYCWGHVFVVLVSTAFFAVFGIANWRILAFIWALVPLCNLFYFSLVPISTMTPEGGSVSFGKLFKSRIFWVFVLLMVCSGASEQAMSQWASAFAEAGLGVSKAIGDLAGPCLFAAMMGCARTIGSKLDEKRPRLPLMIASSMLCIGSYLLAALTPLAFMSLVGCGICGFSVGIMWPGTFSLASERLPGGGTTMFALLALAGDLGCSAGPTLVGFVADAAGGIKRGMLAAIVFPVLLILGLLLCQKFASKKSQN